MIKRLVVSVALLLSALLLSIFSVYKVQSEIEKVLYEIEANDDIYSCAENILALRIDNESVFSMLLKHADADTIDRLHLELSSALGNSDEKEIILLLAEIRAFLTVTSEGEKLKSENIF